MSITSLRIAQMLRGLGVSTEYEQQSMTMAEAGRMVRQLGDGLRPEGGKHSEQTASTASDGDGSQLPLPL